MIKVVHFMPNINYTSGIANLIMNYYREIDRTKIQFDFIIFGKENTQNYEQEIKQMGGNIIRISPPTQYKKFKMQLCKYFDNIKEQKVIFHNHQIAFTIFLYIITKEYGIDKFIVHNHMTKYSDKLISSIRNFILCLPIKFLDVIQFACSEEATKMIFSRKKSVTIINNGIYTKNYKFDNTKRDKIRKNLNLDDSYTIGHIGRFERVKNHKYMIKMFYNIKRQNPYIKFLLVGTGSLKNDIIKELKKYNLYNNTIILENRNDIPELLMAMDVFIFPSKFEGLGISAIEAQATGLPVIMSNKIPKIVKQCDNVDILKIDKKSVKSWVKKIFDYKNIDIDRLNGYNCIENSIFDIKKTAKDLEQKYIDIMKNM